VKNTLFIVILRVIIKMSAKRASVNPLALFLKPQSPAERLAAQQRDREKLQRERQLKELQRERQLKELQEEAKGKGRGCDEEARGAPLHAAPTSLYLWGPLCVCVAIAACKPLTSLSLLLSTVRH
jgi:hypothetical protein